MKRDLLRKPGRRDGFTLLELMIVVAIIGILSSIAVVKYGDLLRKANEGNLFGNLGSLRSAVSIYYAAMDGQYPETLAVLTVSGKYLAAIPLAKAPNYHPGSSSISLGTTGGDSAGWGYNNVALDQKFGAVWVDCTHTDSKGDVWSGY